MQEEGSGNQKTREHRAMPDPTPLCHGPQLAGCSGEARTLHLICSDVSSSVRVSRATMPRIISASFSSSCSTTSCTRSIPTRFSLAGSGQAQEVLKLSGPRVAPHPPRDAMGTVLLQKKSKAQGEQWMRNGFWA